MALGGGVFTAQNKTLPGAYINFVSVARATATLSERGFCAMPMVLDWGAEGDVFTVTHDEFIRNCQKYFGYDYTHEKMKGLRDLFKNALTLYVYKLNKGTKATNAYCTAKHGGLRGNALKTVITANVDNEAAFDVATYMDNALVDKQTVLAASELVANDYVDFTSTATLTLTASTPLSGGENGGEVTGQAWQDALAALEKYSFNVLGCVSTTETIKDLCIEYTKRLRNEVGVKFQCVVYKKAIADHEAVVSVENKIAGEAEESASAVYWVTGALAGCKVNKSITNKVYDGYFNIDVNYTQAQLTEALKAGKFIFHQVGESVRVLEDINTLITVTEEKGEDFKSNQTVRVMDQVGNDIAVLFNDKYLGDIPNNRSGRTSFWNDLVKYFNDLQNMQAIEDFMPEHIIVTAGATKKAVVVDFAITPVNAMAQLYATCKIN